MQYQIITPSQRQTGTWSGGSTEQLFIMPEGAKYESRDFAFRVSTATVALDQSDFTPLPGFIRWIMPLSAGITLEQGQERVVLPQYAAHYFDGALQTRGIGKCVDFNLMLGAGWDGSIVASPCEIICAENGFAGVFAHQQAVHVTLSAEPCGNALHVELSPRDLLVARGACRLAVDNEQPECALFSSFPK